MNGQDLSLFGAAAVVLNDRFGLSWQIPAAG
jgi:predicted 3-demethylubiquinone-9 3-methyltransferase (glyoxalase superfamily)